MDKKLRLFIFAVIGSFVMVIARYSVELGLCGEGAISCRSTWDDVEYVSSIFPIILLISLVSHFVKGAVFNAWWKFARYAIPAVLFASFVISLELHHTPGGFFNVDDEIDRIMTSVVYLLFILGSAFQMYRGFRVKE